MIRATPKKAFSDFFCIVHRYPTSRYAADAHQRMIFSREQFAARELHIAQFYLERKAYMAAARRAQSVLRHYQGTRQIQGLWLF